MNKDVIYIDTEDDVTAIIGKIKSSKEKIVALVPPKRTGVLQSAVNLRLLSRMAENSNKHLVLVTNNKALIALSASARIPVAKNLQSKPEIAEIAALEVDDGEDIIDGSQLPIGELVKTTDYNHGEDVSDDIGTINIDDEGPKSSFRPTPSSAHAQSAKNLKKSNIKIPDFSKFRKKLFLIAAAVVLFIVFLIWAIWFAPAAKVIITAKTEPAPVSMTLNLGGAAATDVNKNIVQTVTKQIKKEVSVEFTATGKEKVGEKAKGVITLSNSNSSSAINVPTGSAFSFGDYNFLTTSSVNVPGAGVVGGKVVAGSVNANVIAGQVGAEYNLAPNAYQSSVGGVTAYGVQMTGGSSHDAIIVTADDVQKASQALVDLPSADLKQQLTKQFKNGEVIIGDSFTIDRADVSPTPSIGAEATAKAKLTSQVTYSLTSISKSELQAFLKNSLNKQISDNNTQRIYNDGIGKIVLSGYLKTDQGATVNVATVGQIGPNIDKEAIKEQVKGKQYGDIQSELEKIKGVSSVDTKFSFFWVYTVPNDIKKIDVEFVLSDA